MMTSARTFVLLTAALQHCFFIPISVVQLESRAAKREVERKWSGVDVDAWQQQQQQLKEMTTLHQEREQDWQEERRHLQVSLNYCRRFMCDL